MSFDEPFFRMLDRMHLVALKYEDEETRVLAESLIPFEELDRKATSKMPDPSFYRDLLLIELIQWFKSDFFSWVDKPQCRVCNKETQRKGSTIPTMDERSWGAGDVEVYWCPGCCRDERFPRYNNPRKLLETRRGRCGEWANCFTLCCRALDFDARYVYDVTDHLWTEVWSERQNKWLHCDSGEESCDTPLVYDVGWGKKLSYIFAFSWYETVDVTWRYVRYFNEALKRRNAVPESMLIRYQEIRNGNYQLGLTQEEREMKLKRRLGELMGMLLEPRPKSQKESQGRITGSLDWRLGRGEVGANKVISNFKEGRRFEFRYCASSDKYTLLEDGSATGTKGWSSMVFRCSNMARKVEHDWKMTYLARTPGSQQAEIEYKFCLDRPAKSVEIICRSECFEGGRVRWTLKSEGSEIDVAPSEKLNLPLKPVSKEVSLVAKLSGGNGDTAWQHTQLFRQKLEDKSDGLVMIFTF